MSYIHNNVYYEDFILYFQMLQMKNKIGKIFDQLYLNTSKLTHQLANSLKLFLANV